jgi:hypothetical protein
MYTMAINTEPMAMGAMGVPSKTTNPMVRTRKKVPTNSVTYRLMMSKLRSFGSDSPNDFDSMLAGHTSMHHTQRFVTQFADRHRTRQARPTSAEGL